MTSPNSNLSTKATLARLMAAEDLKVEISQTARTASFNLMDRTLVLPFWDVKDETFNMLVGHEVSHALYTPRGLALDTACRSISPNHPGRARSYINVVEDARIERLIKSDYPGLKKSFAEGYRELQAKDIFKLTGRDMKSLSLIDRINIHYKLGWSLEKSVPFSTEELELVRRVAFTTTWDDVVALSKDIYEFSKNKPQPEPEQPQDGGEGGKGEKSDEDEGDESESPENSPEEGDEDPEGSEGSDEDEGDESESDEDGESPMGSGGDEESDEESDEDSEGSGDGEDSDEDSDEDSEEGGSEGGSPSDEDGDEGTDTPDSGGKESNESADDDEPAPEALTDDALKQGLSEMVTQTKQQVVTLDLPEWDRGMVTPFSLIESTMASATHNPETLTAFFKKYMEQEGGNIQALWTEFERRKAADAYQRIEVAKTGRLDPLRLAYHKVSDDLFLSQDLVRNGKNHGLYILLDMSGSMVDKIFGTMIQLANLAMFARRAQIPMVVYGFRGEAEPHQSLTGPAAGWKGSAWSNQLEGDAKGYWKGAPEGTSTTRLMTLLETGLSQIRFQKQVASLLLWAMGSSSSEAVDPRDGQDIFKPYYREFLSKARIYASDLSRHGMRLRSTPTNAALLMSLTLVPEFQARHRLQVVNTVVLTDGDATDNLLNLRVKGEDGIYHDRVAYLRDPVTRREYKAFTKGYTEGAFFSLSTAEQQRLFAQILRDRTGTNLIGISLSVGRETSSIQSAMKMVRMEGDKAVGNTVVEETIRKVLRDGWVMVDSAYGFSKVAMLKLLKQKDDGTPTLDSVSVTEGKRGANALSKAFMKSLQKKQVNRPLMSKLAEVMSKNLS